MEAGVEPEPSRIIIFFPSILFDSYVESIPATRIYINFYTTSFPFTKKSSRTKTLTASPTLLDALQYLVNETIKAHREVLAVPQDRPDALAAYQAFASGYIHYHTSAKRYKLVKLWKMAAAEEEVAVYSADLVAMHDGDIKRS
ncbi:hypothetical protein APHAL10511_000711 [Amanita phalloides]|nr:hypothetical protein APHAL10511_000711 [Amanita phalloides]